MKGYENINVLLESQDSSENEKACCHFLSFKQLHNIHTNERSICILFQINQFTTLDDSLCFLEQIVFFQVFLFRYL